MEDDKKFWIADPEHGFKLGKLVDIGTDSWTIQPFDTPGKVCVFLKNIFAIIQASRKHFKTANIARISSLGDAKFLYQN